jgi:hypothetical protein
MSPPVQTEAQPGTNAARKDFTKPGYRRGVVRLACAKCTEMPLKWQMGRTAQSPMIGFGEPFVTERVLSVKLLPEIAAGGPAAQPEPSRLVDEREVSELAHEAAAFAKSMLTPGVGVFSREMLELANRAAEQCARRADEDVKSWAERLAREVGDATD